MSFILWYFIIVIVLTFGLSALSYVLINKEKESAPLAVICNALTIIGGALGSVVAYIIWGRKLGKDRLKYLVNAVIWLAFQVIIFLAAIGPNGESNRAWLQNFYANHAFICWYALIINVITFVVFVIDKIKALTGSWRVMEIVLFALAFIGGALGGIMAMQISNHKVSKNYFATGIPMMFAMHIFIAACFGIGLF